MGTEPAVQGVFPGMPLGSTSKIRIKPMKMKVLSHRQAQALSLYLSHTFPLIDRITYRFI